MVINGRDLLEIGPIKHMAESKIRYNGASYGLGEVGYDIRLKQEVAFNPPITSEGNWSTMVDVQPKKGKFCLASAIEEFDMPECLVAIVHDKSSWARKGLSVFNTVIEPGWKGFLTLELVYHGEERLVIPAGTGIAQVIFHQTSRPASYVGLYQNQPDKPVSSKVD